MSEPVLSLRGLSRAYRTGEGVLEVLRGIDLDVFPGQVVGLIGPSGSGKSSLLHAAGLLERPTTGQIFIEGKDCSKLTDAARTRLRLGLIGFVYQFHHLMAEFSALDNVALPQMIGGAARPAARERAKALLEALGLGQRLDHQPGQLSGGEQQRVAIARALANAPRVVLADEPTGNLDPTTSGAVFQNLYDLTRQTGVALVIATHNMDLARHMDRVFALHDKRARGAAAWAEAIMRDHHRRVFDVGETLVDETRHWGEWADWMEVPTFTFFSAMGAVIERGLNHREVFNLVKPGFDLDHAMAQRVEPGYRHTFLASDFYPDALPCLADLKDQGYRVGLAGNQPEVAEAALKAANVPADFIASSARGWGVEKPSPAFFERVIEATGRSAREIAYVGDRLDNDVIPSMKAGMAAVFIRRGPWGYIQSSRAEAPRGCIALDTLKGLADLRTVRGR